MLLALALTAPPGCRNARSTPPPVFTGDHLEVSASPELIAPALRFACGRNEMAIIDQRTSDDGTLIYELVTLRDEPGEVVATPVAQDRWRITATVGRFGNADEQAALLAALGDRIHALREAGH